MISNVMSNIEELDIQTMLSDIIDVLVNHGYTKVSIGGLLRVVGVDNNVAAEYDNSIMNMLEDDGEHDLGFLTPTDNDTVH